jgi:two-component system, NtrC family, response regulator AtoC
MFTLNVPDRATPLDYHRAGSVRTPELVGQTGRTRMAQTTGTVLIVDSDSVSASELKAVLIEEGLGARAVRDGAEAIEALEERPFDLVIAERAPSEQAGTELLAVLSRRFPEIPVVLAAAGASAAEATAAMRAGAADFVQKPYDREEILFVVRKILEAAARRLEEPPASGVPEGLIAGGSRAMTEAMALMERAAAGSATVLVRGESGTGKELVARAIHEKSPRAHSAFVKIDCTSLPEPLLESELFGYEKGAFTGAAARKPGRVELADGGTLFLDEIGELTPPLQAKLLRLLQDREFERLGSTKTIKIDVRVIAATHRDLETMVERGQFRQDLFYRLNVVPLWLPPLRARRDDIELLARHFCRVFAQANGKPGLELDETAMRVLRGQRWAGNVRQLQNFIERLVVLSQADRLGEEDVRAELGRQVRFTTQSSGTHASVLAASSALSEHQRPASVVGPLEADMFAAEKKAIERALRHAQGNRSLAARLLGVSRSTLYAKLEEHGLL